jgi:hypothetical protein
MRQPSRPISRFTLLKLGFDLRARYDGLFSSPPPVYLRATIERLPGRFLYVVEGNGTAALNFMSDEGSLA